ncbi:MAG: beta-propeller fold lactonase family protein [Conexivisphaerales archaeon]
MNQKAVATLVIMAFVIAACSVVSSPAWAGGAVGTVVGTVTVGDQPHSVAYDPSNGYLYVANFGPNTVSVIDGATNKVVGSAIAVGVEPIGIAYDPADGYLYVANYGSNTTPDHNGATTTGVGTIDVGK